MFQVLLVVAVNVLRYLLMVLSPMMVIGPEPRMPPMLVQLCMYRLAPGVRISPPVNVLVRFKPTKKPGLLMRVTVLAPAGLSLMPRSAKPPVELSDPTVASDGYGFGP